MTPLSRRVETITAAPSTRSTHRSTELFASLPSLPTHCPSSSSLPVRRRRHGLPDDSGSRRDAPRNSVQASSRARLSINRWLYAQYPDWRRGFLQVRLWCPRPAIQIQIADEVESFWRQRKSRGKTIWPLAKSWLSTKPPTKNTALHPTCPNYRKRSRYTERYSTTISSNSWRAKLLT